MVAGEGNDTAQHKPLIYKNYIFPILPIRYHTQQSMQEVSKPFVPEGYDLLLFLNGEY